MIKILKRLIPVRIKNKIATSKAYQLKILKKNYKQDMEKFTKHSFVFTKDKTKRSYEADLIFYYHKIEKGLSLPEPRVGFGRNNVEYLLKTLESYVEKYGWDEVSQISLNTLYAYYEFNSNNNLQLNNLYKRIERLKNSLVNESIIRNGGIKEVTKEEIDKSNINFEDFAFSRYSIRDFAPGEVSIDIIEKAIHIAQKTPSVCNRQSARVYVYTDKDLQKKILKYQNGNAGFGDRASKILIVTSELKDFRGVTERNQSYIDGGMYSMSLIYALHSLGVGTCPLNLSITNDMERKLKKAAKIGDSEVLLMMIAVGHLPDRLNVACSPRRSAKEVMTVY